MPSSSTPLEPETREGLERRAKEAAEEATVELKQQYEEAEATYEEAKTAFEDAKAAYEEALEEVRKQELGELLSEHEDDLPDSFSP